MSIVELLKGLVIIGVDLVDPCRCKSTVHFILKVNLLCRKFMWLTYMFILLMMSSVDKLLINHILLDTMFLQKIEPIVLNYLQTYDILADPTTFFSYFFQNFRKPCFCLLCQLRLPTSSTGIRIIFFKTNLVLRTENT